MSMGKVSKIFSGFALLCGNVLIFYVCMKRAVRVRLRRMESVYERQLEACVRRQQENEQSIQQLRDVKHNLKNYLVSILIYAEHNECEEIIRFVHEIMENGSMKPSAIANSGNLVIDALIGYWHAAAEQAGIDFTADICIPVEMPFRDADICLILGNLLENAVEAASKGKDEKIIKIYMKYDKGNLLLYVMNNYEGQLIKKRNNVFKTTKQDAREHGVGIPSVRRTAAKYQGQVSIDDSSPGCFQVQVVLYGTRK